MAELDRVEGEGGSNRLGAADAEGVAEQVRARLEKLFPERDDPHRPGDATPRLLDAAPRNALRVPFLDAVFPDAMFVYVNRAPAEALAEALAIWESGGAETYPELPGWEGPAWSFLLVPGWEDLRGRQLPEVVTEQWVRTASTLLDDLEALGPERWCVADYEALLSNPADELQRLFKFLGVGWHHGLAGPLVQAAKARATAGAPSVPEELKPLLPRAEEVASQAGELVASPQDGSETRREGESPLRSVYTGSLIRLLDQLRSSLLVSTYQTGKLISIRYDRGTVNTHFRDFQRPMGIAVHDGGFALGTEAEVLDYRNFPPAAARIRPDGAYDACFLPRNSHVTGDISIHEIAYVRGELWVVATAFSCLATLDAAHSFVPRWRPPFISELASEDRCHLNGLAIVNGRPGYVTALGETDEAGAWRAEKASGGVVIDVESGETVVRGLSMPHSPRWHDERLWLLESGKGTLAAADPESGEVETVAELPGFTRGLAFSGDLAFVGLSQIRETATFGGLPIEQLDERLCGIWVVNISSGEVVGFLRFEEQVQEIFEVALLPGIRLPEIAERGSGAAKSFFVVPDGERPRGAGVAAADAPIAAGIDVQVQVTRALALQRERRLAEAIDLFRRAAEARPRSAEIWNHLGNALQDAGRMDEALDAYARAVAADSTFGPALQNIGVVLVAQGRTDEGIERLREAQRVQPADVNRLLIATALPVIYESADDLRARRETLEKEVGRLADEGLSIGADAPVPTNFYAAYQGENDRQLQANLGRIFRGEDLAEGRSSPREPATRDRPRIGFLSAYFRDHTIGRLNLGRIEQLSGGRLEIVVLSVGEHRDEMSSAFREAADRFVSIPGDVAAARRLIAEEELDLLFFADVGMSTFTQALSYSRMAPVQCATWGHPVTTGSPMVDLFLSSELLEIAEADEHYTEELVRLPTLATYYKRPELNVPRRSRRDLQLDEAKHLYVCPQTLFKLHPDFDPLLAEILRRDPEGRLALIEGQTSNWTSLLRARFERTMPDVAGRIDWLPRLANPDFLQLLALADVVLDPPHFSGGNSSYEALGLGSPIVTWPGPLLRSRITHALYSKMGFEELTVDSAEAYIEQAVRLGTDNAWRGTIGERIRESSPSLFEDPAEITDLEGFLAAAAT